MREHKRNPKMTIEQIDKDNWYTNTKYSLNCDKCDKAHSLITQRDDNPEYYTDVTVVCDCGTHVHFELPVN